ncbi:DUF2249 domain-containing protein [Halobaculum marinum]|uniref:DUF2249 domain-containing protein n=1 Tax=Halobaculum marinum TaxID=3031996 RepID=A0ABD5X5S9_9EURY|nr:DUF2249 domain-containing protein [Halobaculum sp. DT55]
MNGDGSESGTGDAPGPWGVAPTAVTTVDDLSSDLREDLGVPEGRAATGIDVRSAPPPEPLTDTVAALTETDDTTVLFQRNDRVPVHLFDRLDERGYEHASVERDGEALTAVWRE